VPRVTLTVDDTEVMDIDTATWTSQPPAIADMQRNPTRDPWSIPVLQAIAGAAINQRDTNITVRTGENSWGMDVSWPA